jgi:hypothetical protein
MARGKLLVTLLLLGSIALLFGTACASSSAAAPDAPAAPAAPPPPPPPPAVVGSWNLTIETPVGTQQSTLVVTGTAEALEGKLVSEQGEAAVRDVVFDGSKLQFAITIDAQGQQMELTFEGAVDGDSLTGAFQSPFGPAPVTGTRGGA